MSGWYELRAGRQITTERLRDTEKRLRDTKERLS